MENAGAAVRPPRLLIEAMSFRPVIPWQVALPQSRPPLHQPLIE
jgi:hypothetical protein